MAPPMAIIPRPGSTVDQIATSLGLLVLFVVRWERGEA